MLVIQVELGDLACLGLMELAEEDPEEYLEGLWGAFRVLDSL